ncbi:hypothetical protein PsYK624_016070 [Phanerochaete sordida]|uniref:Uncharacterized protein n=1 Tax=Phanerochaete sordida TaxID=48140 RepID=A0A9P3L906_9APHY|nr:hypothetical protein PsYK624_016070 [Phanerochaete sordida]
MTLSFDTPYLAGPGDEAITDFKSRDATRTPIPSLHSPTASRRVRVTAVVSTRPDGSQFTAYEVEELPDYAEQSGSPPLLGCRRSRSQSSIRSDELSPRTPSPSIFGSSISMSPMTPPGAPRIGCLPSPKLEDEQLVFPYPEWAAFDSDSSCSKAVHLTNALRFEPFADDEQSHYYLPTNLLSPHLEMSETEFKESVHRWTERRKNGRAHEEAEDEEESGEEYEDEDEDAD